MFKNKLKKISIVVGALLIVAFGSKIAYSANSLTEIGSNIITGNFKATGNATTTGDHTMKSNLEVKGNTDLGNSATDTISFKGKSDTDLDMGSKNVTNTDAINADSIEARNVFTNSKAADVTIFKEGNTIYADGGTKMIASSTDADSVIQSAIDHASPNGDKIFISSGNYKIDNTIKINSTTEGISLVGSGRSTKFEITSSTKAIHIVGKDNYDTDNNVEGRVISNIYFYGTSWSERGKYAIHAQGLLKSRISDNWFKNLRYGIKIEDGPGSNNQGNWANKVTDNEFEVVTRPIVMDSAHDCIVSNNHSEGTSTAAPFNTFNDSIESRGISIIDQSMNMHVLNNVMESHNDSSGNYMGYYISNATNNYEISNNAGTAAAAMWLNYDKNLNNKKARLSFSNNHFPVFWSGNKIESNNFSLKLSFNNHSEGSIKLEQSNGAFGELDVLLSNSTMKNHYIFDINTEEGAFNVSGLSQSSSSTQHGLFLKTGNYDSIHLTDSNIRYFVIGGGDVNADSTIVSDNYFTQYGPIVKGPSDIKKFIVDSNTLGHNSNNFVDLRTGSDIDYAIVSNNIIDSNTLIGGAGISTSTKNSNIIDAAN